MINNLTGLRFYLAIWVVIYHQYSLIDIAYLNEILKKGYLAVDFFFVLSGYILTHVYLNYYSQTPDLREIKGFIKKRFARVYPVHFFTLVGAILYYLLLNYVVKPPKELDYFQLIPQLFMLHAWGVIDAVHWNFPSWSISAEWFAYIFIFPVSWTLYRKAGTLLYVVIAFSFLFAFFQFTNVYFGGRVVSQMSFSLFRVSAEFLYGTCAYLIFCNFLHFQFSEKYLIILLWIMLTIASLLTAVLPFDYIFIVAIPWILYLLHANRFRLEYLFANKTVLFLGEISYSIYMTHFFSIRVTGILSNNYFGYDVNDPIRIFVYLFLAIFFGWISFITIERPFRNLIIKSKRTQHTNKLPKVNGSKVLFK